MPAFSLAPSPPRVASSVHRPAYSLRIGYSRISPAADSYCTNCGVPIAAVCVRGSPIGVCRCDSEALHFSLVFPLGLAFIDLQGFSRGFLYY